MYFYLFGPKGHIESLQHSSNLMDIQTAIQDIILHHFFKRISRNLYNVQKNVHKTNYTVNRTDPRRTRYDTDTASTSIDDQWEAV